MLPAYAGMIPAPATSVSRHSRAPRVCGDDPLAARRAIWNDAVLPAYAGMIRPCGAFQRELRRAPRVCGDDPTRRALDRYARWCSPRMRG